MTRSKKDDHGDDNDQISDLPSNVIDGILEHLNIVDSVRTSILSRKWRYKWASVPQLEFSVTFFDNYDHLGNLAISSIITEVILLHNGPIHKFTLDIPLGRRSVIERLNKWILYLSRNGIKYLALEYRDYDYPYQMPSHVFSCQELTYLKLYYFQLSVPPNFCGFKNLLALHLYYIAFESSGALGSLISGCPLLEELTISCCEGFECIDFFVPTLKVLSVYGDENEVIKSICLNKAKNLIDLTLIIAWHMVEKGTGFDFIFKGLPKIHRLTLGTTCDKILFADTISQTLLKSFSSLEYLKLIVVLNERGEFLFIVDLLQNAPNLVELVIESQTFRARDLLAESTFGDARVLAEELECKSRCLSQLQTVNIKVGSSFKYAMSLTRFILANCSSLRTLTLEVGRDDTRLTDAHILLRISQDLLGMERASQRAKVNFLPLCLVGRRK